MPEVRSGASALNFIPLLPRGTDSQARNPMTSLQCYSSAKARLAYVKTAKAASTMLIALLRRQFPDLNLTSRCEQLEGYTFVTSAREPLERARSAYGEVDARAVVRRRTPSSRYYGMPHGDEPARFLTFLEDVFHQRFSHMDYTSGCMPQHAEPPLLLRTPAVLRVPVQLHILRGEQLLDDWRELLSRVKPYSHLPTRISDYHVGETQRRGLGLTAVIEMDKTFNMTPEATCRACALLRREYACFGYPFPPACSAYKADAVWPAGYMVIGEQSRVMLSRAA